MRSQLDRAIRIAAKTGDKIIVVDEENDRSLAVMNLDEYEKLLNGENKGNKEIESLTEEELLDKINSDIVTWKDANEDKGFLAETDDEDDDSEEELAPIHEDNEIVPDFNVSEDPVLEEKEVITEPAVVLQKEIPEVKADENENLYYYNEPEKTETAQEDSGFTSIKDELRKNHKTWEIPAEVKQAAEEVKV